VSTAIESVYALSSVIFIAAGLAMSGMGLRAYAQTSHGAMLHLSLGFALAVSGTAATLISAFLYGFTNTRWLLMVQTGLFTLGLLLVMYSIVNYET
jgi:hypothetical protein